MTMTRRALRAGCPFFLGVPALAILAFGQESPQHPAAHGDDAWGPEQAAQLFAQSCSGCHAAPDPTFATDRAWLGQIADTA
jgi:mono/diheme cytochrome c family protein